MNKPIKLSKESEEEYIVRASKVLYSNGYHISEIAEKLDCKLLEVYNSVVREGRRFTTDEEYLLMMALRGNGMSYRQIAKEIGKSATCVRERIINGPVILTKNTQEHTLTDRQIDQIIKWYKDGKQIRWIANKLGISRNAVSYRLTRAGVKTNRDIPIVIQPVTKTEKYKFFRLHKKGHSISEIAAKCDRDPRTVKKYLKEFI